MPTTVILGGGLSGLTAAYYLAKRLPSSHNIKVLEKSPQFGGWIKSFRTPDNLLFEAGPRSVRPVGLSGLLTLDIINDLGLTDQLVTVSKSHPTAKNRFIYFNGGLNRAPSSLPSAIRSSFSSQSPFSGLLPTVLAEPFRFRKRPHEDESVDSFVSARFSPDFASNVLSALVHGIYAGDTRELSIQAIFPSLWKLEQRYGSVVLGMLRGGIKASAHEVLAKKQLDEKLGDLATSMKKASIYSFRDGLEVLPKALVQHLRAQPNVELLEDSAAEQIDYDGDRFSMTTQKGDIVCERLVSALSYPLLQRLLPALPELPQSSVTVGVVNFAFPTGYRLPVKGFGYLIPRTVPVEQNPHRVLGVVFDSEMFEPDGPVKLTVMMGGAYWNKTTPPTDVEVQQGALDTLRLHGLVPADLEPTFIRAHVQANCIPQYTVGHCERMQGIHRAIGQNFKGQLGVVGSSYAGVGINDCVKSSWEYASTSQGTGLESFVPS